MREWKLQDIEERVRERTPEATRAVLRSRRGRVMHRRPRDEGEQLILDRLCRRAWERALAQGKVKIISEREWYCDFD